MLIEEGHQVDVACKIEKAIDIRIFKWGCNVLDIPFSRSPIRKDNITAYKILRKTLEGGKYDIVHTHTPIASVITRLLCKDIPNIRVIYTAHGFHFFNGAPMVNWLIYYPIERHLSKFTDTIITINNEDYNRAKTSFGAKRVEYIPGVGIDVKKFQNLSIDKIQKRKEIGVPEDSFVLLSVGELNKNKNHEVVIKAIEKINNNKIHYVICGEGPLEGHLRELSQKLKLSNNVHLIGFRYDIPEIYKASDLFLFPSLREGLGIAAIEAMASGLPIITSNVHGINDYSINGITGYSVRPLDINGLADSIKNLFQDYDMRSIISNNNIQTSNKYELSNTIKVLKGIIGGQDAEC